MIWDYGRIDPPAPEIAAWTGRNYERCFSLPFAERLELGGSEADFEWRTPAWSDLTHIANLSFNDEAQEKPNYLLDDDVSIWHTDGNDWRYIAVWSTNGPTEFRRKSRPRGEPYRLGVKHLAVLDNHKIQHRIGRYRLDLTTRHFVRLGLYADTNWRPDKKFLVDI